jgi:hypothetical protein
MSMDYLYNSIKNVYLKFFCHVLPDEERDETTIAIYKGYRSDDFSSLANQI